MREFFFIDRERKVTFFKIRKRRKISHLYNSVFLLAAFYTLLDTHSKLIILFRQINIFRSNEFITGGSYHESLNPRPPAGAELTWPCRPFVLLIVFSLLDTCYLILATRYSLLINLHINQPVSMNSLGEEFSGIFDSSVIHIKRRIGHGIAYDYRGDFWSGWCIDVTGSSN